MYLGESLVSVVNGRIQVYYINATACEVELTVPPVEIEEFEVIEPAPRSAKRTANSENLINQLTVIDEYTRHKYMELAIVATVNWLINIRTRFNKCNCRRKEKLTQNYRKISLSIFY